MIDNASSESYIRVNKTFALQQCRDGDVRFPNGSRFNVIFGDEYSLDYVDIVTLVSRMIDSDAEYLA